MSSLPNKELQIVSNAWTLSPEEIISKLNTGYLGISEPEAVARRAKYGSNLFHYSEKTNPVFLFLKQFLSPLIFLLLAAGTLSALLSEWVDTAIIAFAVLLNVFLGFFHEYHAENTLEKLKTFIKDSSRVIREGRELEIDSSLLVPGDVVKLSYGRRVPADVRILSTNGFQVDEAILTGESLPVEKEKKSVNVSAIVAERKSVAYAGTLVVQGYATGVVYATGNKTEIGKIAGIVSKTKRIKTPLQKSIKNLAWVIFAAVLVVVAGVLLLGIYRGEGLVPMLLLSSAVAVGAVPEALPISLTVILSVGALRIAERRSVLRKLAAAETLGSATVIMTDKTGTLTLADMQLVGVHETTEIISIPIVSEQNRVFSQSQKNLLGLALSNIDVLVENPDQPKKEWVFRGRPFEVNIAKACRAQGLALDAISSVSSSLVLPFNSTNKFSVSERESTYIVMGAPDILLDKSKMSKENYLKVSAWIEKVSTEGKRVIGLASFPKKEEEPFSLKKVKDLSFLGIFVFYDPVRPEVPEAIKNIKSHGVKIVLVTGDLPGTAIAVARSLNWHISAEEVLTGNNLKGITDEELAGVLSKIKIFARVTPEDKLRIGRLYQQSGEIVAMTGDGVNDAPSLKAMDIGISLGSGSDVAKSAADMVLLDDNLETISHAIDEGRRILSNIRKSFTYLMSNSLDEVFVISGSLLFGLPLPITALQIIWVNLFTGSLPAISFAFDESIDKSKKIKHENTIFTKSVNLFIFGVGVLSSLLLFTLYYVLVKLGFDLGLVRSVFFVCFSSYILAIAFSFRSLHRPIFSYHTFSNMKLNQSIILGTIILILTVSVPFLREIFGLAPFPLSWLPMVMFWIMFNVGLVEVAKYFLRRKHQSG